MKTPIDTEKFFRKSLLRKLVSKYHEYTEALDKMIFWAWHMRWSYDFDAHTMYWMLYYKLDRMYKCFRDYSSCVWDSDINNPKMRKLRITRELAKRLAEDNYTTQADKIQEIYGELKLKSGPRVPGKPSVPCEFFMTKATKADQEKAQARLHKAYLEDDRQKEYERKWFFKLLEKNIDFWWD